MTEKMRLRNLRMVITRVTVSELHSDVRRKTARTQTYVRLVKENTIRINRHSEECHMGVEWGVHINDNNIAGQI